MQNFGFQNIHETRILGMLLLVISELTCFPIYMVGVVLIIFLCIE